LKLEQLSKFLGQQAWFAGPNLTWIDFVLYELLEAHRLFSEDIFQHFANLGAFLKRFEAIPAVGRYQHSQRCTMWPINDNMAKWGTVTDPNPYTN